MSLLNELNSRLKDAMKARNSAEMSVIRMIKSRITELKTSAGFDGEIDDKAVLRVIAAYSKQMSKALGEFEKAGNAGEDQIAALRYEIDCLKPFLPSKLGEQDTLALVAKIKEEQGIEDSKMVGRLVGAVMKSHKESVDAVLVKQAAQALLTESAK